MVSASSSPATTPISRTTRLSNRPSNRPPSLGQLHRPQLAISKQLPPGLPQRPASPAPASSASSAPPPAIPAVPSLPGSQWRQTPPGSVPLPISRPPPPPNAFQRLEAVLVGMPHYLDQPGPQNRLILSIRSGVPEEVEYGLAVLLAASFYEPELVPLARFPGLLDALVELVEAYASAGPFTDPAIRTARRHALEAAQVLRNLATQDPNAALLAASPRVLRAVCARLESDDPGVDAEMLGLLFDLLESLAAQAIIRLDQPLERPAVPPPAQDDPDGLPEQPWSAALVDRLDALTDSADRALVLGAFRCFAALGLLPVNQTYMASHLVHRASGTWPCSLARAVALLALPDVELLMSVLDYLYALTATGTLTDALCTRHADLGALLRLLLVHSHHQLRVHAEPPEALPPPGPAWYFERPPPPAPSHASPGPPTATLAGRTPQTQTMSEVNKILLSEHQLGELARLAEPQRAHRWMSRVFEADANAEVQQVTLWLAYKTQFEPHANRPNGNSMIAPADAIKLTSDVFPNAVPSVHELPSGEKRFVIKGMRVRERQPYAPATFRCRWQSCPESVEPVGSEALHAHLLGAHLGSEEAGEWVCRWHTCAHRAGTRRELELHVRTHMPLGRVRRPAAGGEPAFRTYRHERWETPAGPEAELGPVGIGYVALLVLRNLARAVAGGVASAAKRSGAEGPGRESGGAVELGKLVVGAVEKQVVVWARKDRQLGVVSMEILGCVCAIEDALEGLERGGGGGDV